MHCSDIEDLLSSYLDHELLPEESSFVEKHLEHCDYCRQTLADLQETSNLLQSLPNVPMPDGFQEQLHELLVEVNRDTYVSAKERFGQNWLQRLFSSYRLASTALVLVLCFVVYSFSIFYKNMSYTDQAPALMNAEIAASQEDGAGDRLESQDDSAELESKERASQTKKDANLKTLTKGNESTLQSNKSKGQTFLIIVMMIVVPLLMVRIISKFRRK